MRLYIPFEVTGLGGDTSPMAIGDTTLRSQRVAGYRVPIPTEYSPLDSFESLQSIPNLTNPSGFSVPYFILPAFLKLFASFSFFLHFLTKFFKGFIQCDLHLAVLLM